MGRREYRHSNSAWTTRKATSGKPQKIWISIYRRRNGGALLEERTLSPGNAKREDVVPTGNWKLQKFKKFCLKPNEVFLIRHTKAERNLNDEQFYRKKYLQQQNKWLEFEIYINISKLYTHIAYFGFYIFVWIFVPLQKSRQRLTLVIWFQAHFGSLWLILVFVFDI